MGHEDEDDGGAAGRPLLGSPRLLPEVVPRLARATNSSARCSTVPVRARPARRGGRRGPWCWKGSGCGPARAGTGRAGDAGRGRAVGPVGPPGGHDGGGRHDLATQRGYGDVRPVTAGWAVLVGLAVLAGAIPFVLLARGRVRWRCRSSWSPASLHGGGYPCCTAPGGPSIDGPGDGVAGPLADLPPSGARGGGDPGGGGAGVAAAAGDGATGRGGRRAVPVLVWAPDWLEASGWCPTTSVSTCRCAVLVSWSTWASWLTRRSTPVRRWPSPLLPVASRAARRASRGLRRVPFAPARPTLLVLMLPVDRRLAGVPDRPAHALGRPAPNPSALPRDPALL